MPTTERYELSTQSLLFWLERGAVPCSMRGVLSSGEIGCATSWHTRDEIADPSTVYGGVFVSVITIEPVTRGSDEARFQGVPDWFFDASDAQARRSNGGPPL